MTKLFFNLSITLAFIILILFFSISFSNAGVLVDSRMGHQKDSGYKSERFAVDVVPGIVIRPEVRHTNRDRGSNNRNRQWGLERKDDIFPSAWKHPYVDPWGRKFTSPGGLPLYGPERCERPRHRGDRYHNRRPHTRHDNRYNGLRGGLHR